MAIRFADKEGGLRVLKRIHTRLSWIGLICLLIAGAWVTATPHGQAHAYLQSSIPAQDARIEQLPDQIVLNFTEPVEVPFSIFKVYAVETQEDLLKTKAAASQLVAQVLGRRNDQNDEARVDKDVSPARGAADTVTLGLKDGVEPGAYVVMWRVLSIDTHRTEGFFVFEYDPS